MWWSDLDPGKAPNPGPRRSAGPAEPVPGASKVARPGKRRRSWPENHRPAARLGRRNASTKADGIMERSKQCPTPTKVTPSETTCLGLFWPIRCTIAVIFKLTPKIA